MASNSIQRPNNHSTVQVKATLYHLNGEMSEITMNIPKYTSWADFIEAACRQVAAYIDYLASQWVIISQYDIETFTHKTDGSTEEVFLKQTFEIPLDKVYDPTKLEWVSLEDGRNRRREQLGIPTA